MGNEDLSLRLHIPDYVEWNYINDLRLAKERGYDVCVLNRCVNEKEARILLKRFVHIHYFYWMMSKWINGQHGFVRLEELGF